eukprot:UN27447
MSRSGFAPLFIPFKRRLETMVVAWAVFAFVPFQVFAWLFTVILLYFYPITRIPLICYLTWLNFFDDSPTSASRYPWVRKFFLWKHFADYFPLKIHKTAQLDPKHNYLFCYHPHGILSIGCACAFATDGAGFDEMYPGIKLRLLTLGVNFNAPFSREYLLAHGACTASKKNYSKYIS